MKRLFYSALFLLTVILSPACDKKGNPGCIIINPDKKDVEPSYVEPAVGSKITPWIEGFMDIHFINTTAGECVFLIFPDGTQFLIDAAGSEVATGVVSGKIENTGIRKRWDPSKNSTHFGKFIAAYLRECMAWTKNGKIDYMLLTHLHNDHFGGAAKQPVSEKSPTYTQQSFAYIMDTFPVGLLMDRGYPDYDYPVDMLSQASNKANIVNYVNAVKWHVANNGVKAELFKAGSDTQIHLNYKPAAYPSFSVRNLAVNGEIWTGSGTSTIKTFPDKSKISSLSADNCPAENVCSAMLKVNYGKFGFATFGDAQFNGMSAYLWKDIETPVSKVCSEAEVMKADHHGSTNTNGVDYYCKEQGCYANGLTFVNPQCWIVNSWTDAHPRKDTYEKIIDKLATTDTYFTNTCSDMTSYKSYSSRMKGGDGHIVVRVRPGGDSYNVYVLTDSDGKMTVKYASAPYRCR